MNPTLSVIIPVYKVENYLERCVKSVLNQDYRDFEVILVDDGSPDRCPQICDDLAVSDERITVVHKPNGGLSSARNKGVEVARGKYLAFLDSDDQWAEGKLKPLMEQLVTSDVDMLVYDCIDLYPNGDVRKRDDGDFFKNSFRVLDVESYYREVVTLGNFMESACTKILKRDFIVENGLFFTLGLTGEDSEWMIRLLRVARCVAVSSIELFVCTCLREGSIQNSISPKNIRDLIGTIDKSIAYCKAHEGELCELELSQCSYLLANATGILCYINDKKERQSLIALLKERTHLFEYALNNKTKKVRMAYKLLGFNLLVRLLGLYVILMKKNILNGKKKING